VGIIGTAAEGLKEQPVMVTTVIMWVLVMTVVMWVLTLVVVVCWVK
jgi:hypothetical protein